MCVLVWLRGLPPLWSEFVSLAVACPARLRHACCVLPLTPSVVHSETLPEGLRWIQVLSALTTRECLQTLASTGGPLLDTLAVVLRTYAECRSAQVGSPDSQHRRAQEILPHIMPGLPLGLWVQLLLPLHGSTIGESIPAALKTCVRDSLVDLSGATFVDGSNVCLQCSSLFFLDTT